MAHSWPGCLHFSGSRSSCGARAWCCPRGDPTAVLACWVVGAAEGAAHDLGRVGSQNQGQEEEDRSWPQASMKQVELAHLFSPPSLPPAPAPWALAMCHVGRSAVSADLCAADSHWSQFPATSMNPGSVQSAPWESALMPQGPVCVRCP